MPSISCAACRAERMSLIRSSMSGGNLLPSSSSKNRRNPLCRKVFIIGYIVNSNFTFYKGFASLCGIRKCKEPMKFGEGCVRV